MIRLQRLPQYGHCNQKTEEGEKEKIREHVNIVTFLAKIFQNRLNLVNKFHHHDSLIDSPEKILRLIMQKIFRNLL